jgi:8-amino-7-oxononanoate synthase
MKQPNPNPGSTRLAAPPTATEEFSTGSGSLFGGFFAPGRKFDFQKQDLVDGRARRVFEMMGQACDFGVYPYQLPLESRSGPWVKAEGREFLMLSSYDYLGLIGDTRIDEASIEAIRQYGTGTGGVRLLTGTADIHREMERDIAAFKGTESAITFTSGYLANLAVIASLLTPQDRVILDALSHRSLVDACRLGGVPIQRFRHNDMDSLRHELRSGPAANRTLIVADGVFSMDGDICNLPDLVAIKRESGSFLMIDESHASGVLGASGRGTDEHFGIATSDVDIWSGSLAKAIPSNGGFLAVSQELAIYLQHAGAPFIFSAALAPSAVAAVRASLAVLASEPQRVARIHRNAEFFRAGLQSLGYDTAQSETAVIPIIMHDETTAALLSGRLREEGIIATPILFPAVPLGSARLRLCVTAAHSLDDLEFALDVFSRVRP